MDIADLEDWLEVAKARSTEKKLDSLHSASWGQQPADRQVATERQTLYERLKNQFEFYMGEEEPWAADDETKAATDAWIEEQKRRAAESNGNQ